MVVELMGVCPWYAYDRSLTSLLSFQNVINSSQHVSYGLMCFGFFVVGLAFATQVRYGAQILVVTPLIPPSARIGQRVFCHSR